MKNQKISPLLVLVLTGMLLFGLFMPAKASKAAAENGIDQAVSLTKGKEAEGTLEKPEQSQWYKISPSKEEISKDSHMKLKVKSNELLAVSVYSSKEKAKQDDTFDQYRVSTAAEQKAEVNVPHAWEGPYYIKVEYLGEEEPPEGEAQSEAPGKATYTIGYDGITIQPSDQEAASQEECPVELSVDQKKSGKTILSQLRTIRDQWLNKTEEGKKLSGLYYKTAPFLVSHLVANKDDRNAVYQNLVTLKPLFKDVAENGANSSHTVTEKEQKAINSLYKMTLQSVPDFIKADMEKQAEKIGLTSLEGKSSGYLISKQKLAPESAGQTSKVIVKMKHGKSLSSLQKSMKGYGIQSNEVSSLDKSDELFDDMYSLDINGEKESDGTFKAQAESTAEKLSNMPGVEFAEPVQTYRSLSNDVQYPHQWPLHNSGKDGGNSGSDVKFEAMQNLLGNKTLQDTLIAVVDTGVDSTLADLKGKVRTDLGKNFVGRNDNALDDQGHGTHVSGIIAAQQDNGYSMAGLNAHAQIIPVKVLDSTGMGDTEQIALGIKYAVDQGAKVINLSLGGGYSRVLEYALNYAASHGVTVAAASGNEAAPEVGYPASSRYAISVGATNKLDVISEFSNYGEGLDLAAPGSDIPSLVPNGNVTYMSGTSMATPYVTATAGLLLSQNPSLTPSEVEKILDETADNITFDSVDGGGEAPTDENGDPITDPKIPGIDWYSGNGRLNAFHAVSAVELDMAVNQVKDNQQKVKGSAKEGTKIEVVSGTKTLGTATAGADGTYQVKIPLQKKNTVLHVKGTKGKAETSIKTVVKEGQPPAKPEVGSVTVNDTAVTGKASANANIKVMDKSKKGLASAKADSKGKFSVKIAKQKAGTVLYVTATDTTKKESEPVKVVVES
ncbi:S8 family peptidase [Bacillus atrophaeus]|uniref:S8 family peptidase n=1 Tax=Bacillus atrophaeus TaxID=1452 RepID=UPI00240D6935|nr:S8 family serine peptidase [Bacillus atrophaeus]